MFDLRSIVRTLAGVALGAAVAATAAADPPDRVARLSYVSGTVSFRPASVDEWTTATLNYPLTIGDHIWNDRGSRSELEFGAASVRLAPESEFSVIDLDDHVAQLRITQGTMTVRVRSLDADDAVEIDTPSGAVSLLRPGFYRIDVAEDGETSTVTVRSGEAEVTAGAGTLSVRAQESVSLAGVDQPVSRVVAAMRSDDFEDWCLTRDRRAETAIAARYVPADMPGYADLDQYGAWQQESEYGPIWIPRVRAEWVPYRYGHWVWVDPWGWTWIDDAPWGFAPFHYGRWVHLSSGWGWTPGRVVARPVYAPALVAFVGGAGWQASVRVGSEPVAWFPLGPREPFIPGYRVSETYVRRVNITHVNVTSVDVTNITYVNREVPGAVTAVPRDAFVRARPVAAVAVAVPRESIRSAPAASAAPVPREMPVRSVDRAARVAAPPAAAVDRPVVVRRAPPEAARTRVRERAAGAPAPAVPQRTPPQQAPQPQNQAQPAQAQPRPAAPAAAEPVRRPPERPQPQQPPQQRPAQERPAQEQLPQQPRQQQPAAQQPAPQQPPQQRPTPPPAAAPRQAPNGDAELAARHAQERAQLDAKQAAERAQLQARHQQEVRAAHDPGQKQQLQRQHQEEQKAVQERQRQEREAVQERQRQEREAVQKRQQEERKKKGG
jgi:hypothetical protein